jgi:two-component system phosphate regulon sensor histidine kinase PhoR
VFFVFASWVILQQKRLSEEQIDFINNMTHEFKTPISTIFISANVLRQPTIIENPRRLMNYANIIHDEATRLKNQVERVLQMATIDEDKIRLNREPINIHDLINKTVQNIDAILKEREGEITCDFQAGNATVLGDSLHLTNIIYNLLDNAIKYCEDAPVITIKTHTHPKNWLLFEIHDNGIGISRDHSKKVWDKFYRVPTGNVHDVKGFGLGLNYVKVVVAAHKGTVKLSSALGVGTVVSVHLPLT